MFRDAETGVSSDVPGRLGWRGSFIFATLRQSTSGLKGQVVANIVARIAAIVSLAIATLIVARVDGAAGVGVFSLLRILPPVLGVLAASGLPSAMPYFLAGASRDDRRVRPTLLTIAVIGGALGAGLWAASSPLLGRAFFRSVDTSIVAWAGLTVLTQLLVATAKGAAQGTNRLRCSNTIIVLEELLFIPAFAALRAFGISPVVAIVASLVLTDVGTASVGWGWLTKGGFFTSWRAPSVRLAKQIMAYGARSQLGYFILLVNLRLDFAILASLVGPIALGVYAVATKFAELIRLPTLALQFVLYPRYSREDVALAESHVRRIAPRVSAAVLAAAIPLAVVGSFAIPALYGSEFKPAITPMRILLIGLIVESIAGLITAFLFGRGRPGLNSIAMAAGLVVTVALDLALVPRLEATGAAIASTASYATSTAFLVWFFLRVRRTSAATNPAVPASVDVGSSRRGKKE